MIFARFKSRKTRRGFRPIVDLLESRVVPTAQFIDPDPAVGNGFGTTILPLSTGNVVITSPNDNAGGTHAGAVYLFNGATGAIISTLLGSHANDAIGSAGITALSNGNFVVKSPVWNGVMGAVTFGSGTIGVSGTVSASNSLVGSAGGDNIGSHGITALSNGNYVVDSPNWNGGMGAVTFGSGTAGISGVISANNSLIGSSIFDLVGYNQYSSRNGITVLSNGNYVVESSNWHGGKGAVTFGSGTTGFRGVVSANNSLVGSSADDLVGNDSITALSNGNFVVGSPNWNGGMGAVTFGNGTAGFSGAVSASNSLIGSTAGDYIGSSGIMALSNGNYAVASPRWNGGMGAATFGSGTAGISGVVGAANSLVGSAAGDQVGYKNGSDGGITALSNGNYVVSSPGWNGGMGAATFGSGTAGISGAVSAINSLVGSSVNDHVGVGITALSNGNYVVDSSNWNSNMGAATFGSGMTGINGAVSANNSLVGSSAGDFIGFTTALSNGNYLVDSPNWNDGMGAVTFGSGTTGISGVITAANSLVGSSSHDYIGSNNSYYDIIELSNGNYVVQSPSWNFGLGAVTFGNGMTGISGVVSANNSLVGGNNVYPVFGGNYGITPLSNGNYVVQNPYSQAYIGAATFGSGVTGISGFVSANNSLIGSSTGDQVGYAITALNNGNYVVINPNWNGNVGAVTFGSGTTGISGVVSANNSLVGSTKDDQVGSDGITLLSNGNYVVKSSHWTNGSLASAGALTLGSGISGISGTVSATNSLVGLAANSGLSPVVTLDNVNGTFIGGFVTEGSGIVRASSQTVVVSVANGVLTIQGDNSNHAIVLQYLSGDPTQTQILDAGTLIQTVTTTSFTSVVVILGNGTNSFVINAADGNPIPTGGLTVTGGTGTNTFIGPNTPNTWAITAANAGTLNTNIAFTNIANIIGGTDVDAFQFNAGGSISGSLDGGGGTGGNTLDYSAYGSRSVVSLANSAATAVKNLSSKAIAHITAAIGNASTGNVAGSTGNLLVGPNVTTTWNITANNAGNFNLASDTFTFSNFPGLTGGNGADTFKMIGTAKLANSVGGGAGTNILDYSRYSGRVVVSLASYAASGIKNLSGSGIANFQTIIGSPNATNLLVASNADSTWNLNGANIGTLSPTAYGILAFSAFANLTGGTGKDNFVFNTGAIVSGAIDGRITGGANTLDYSTYGARVVVSLANSSATAVRNASGSSVYDFQNIIGSTFGNVAGTNGNLLVGPSTATDWHITANNAGTLGTSPISFSAFPNLTGSKGDDDFIFNNNITLLGSLDGGLGTGKNTLDYSAWTTTVTVNLAKSTAIGVVKAYDIQNVFGGSANDTIIGSAVGGFLVGNGGADTITAGTGRSLIIGGKGNDTITGGPNGDILIQGTTSYDNNPADLLAILAEWQSSDSYSTRIATLRTGAIPLYRTITVLDDGGSNTLTGYSSSPNANELDWFFANLAIGHDTLLATQIGDITN